MKWTLRLAGLAGLLLFAGGFALTFVSSLQIERAGRAFIQLQVEKQVRTSLDGGAKLGLEQAAGVLAGRYREETATLRRWLDDGLPERVATVVAQMQDADCECRRWLAATLRRGAEGRLGSLASAQAQLTSIIQGKYADVVAGLLRDLRIFTGTNAAVFLLLLLASFLRPRAIAQLFLPLSLMLGAVLVSGYFYLFRQNWFFTILHNDYVGYGYLGYLLAVFALLVDVAVNRARVVTAIVNTAFAALGRAGPLIPC